MSTQMEAQNWMTAAVQWTLKNGVNMPIVFLKNGMESSTSPKTDQMEEDGLQFHAHFDHTHNRAVLVMKQGQVD